MAVRVWRGVRALETKGRDGVVGFGGSWRTEGVFERRDAGCGWMGEDWRRSRSVGVAFMLAGLLGDLKRVILSIRTVNSRYVLNDGRCEQ